jgi:RNA polymerase sigma factor (sigma-70 family)
MLRVGADSLPWTEKWYPQSKANAIDGTLFRELTYGESACPKQSQSDPMERFAKKVGIKRALSRDYLSSSILGGGPTMASGMRGSPPWREIESLHRVGLTTALSDGELLERFATGRGREEEASFTALLDRHGPMVLQVCRQILTDGHEAEDAFQATFLVLVRKAASVKKRDSVASWLYGVAQRVAMQVRTESARRRTHERRAGRPAAVDPRGYRSGPESWVELHEEIDRLPWRYREPIVLCYLEGLTTEAAARRLGCPKGTVLSRLARGREHLRRHLTRRGLAIPGGLLAAGLWTSSTRAALPGALRTLSIHAALRFAERTVGAAALTSTAASLAKGALQAMALSKLRFFAAGALACGLAVGTVQSFARPGAATRQEPAGPQAAAGQAAQAAPPQDASKQRLVELQARLEIATRRNEVLQRLVHDLQAEVRALEQISPSGSDRRTEAMNARGSKAQGAAAEPAADPSSKKGANQDQARAIGASQQTVLVGQSSSSQNKADNDSEEMPEREPYFRSRSGLIFAASPTGNRVIAHDAFNRAEQSVILNATKDKPLKVSFREDGELVSLHLNGPRITRIAVYDIPARAWSSVDLSEPYSGELRSSRSGGNGTAAYDVGSHLYTYSVRKSGVWDHLDVGNISDAFEGRFEDLTPAIPARR